jgi:hypothetical protein
MFTPAQVVEECRGCGFIVTLLGRRRYFPRINERSCKDARSQRAQVRPRGFKTYKPAAGGGGRKTDSYPDGTTNPHWGTHT